MAEKRCGGKVLIELDKANKHKGSYYVLLFPTMKPLTDKNTEESKDEE